MKHFVARTLVACLLASAAICTPLPARAEVLPADVVSERKVGTGSLAQLAPDVNIPAGALVTSDGRVLWSRDASDRRAIASVTKLMTAIVVLDRLSLDDTLRVPSSAMEIGESEAGLRAGETLTVREALDAALVKSGNEAALALALRTSKNENAFVSMMNQKAAELGLNDTKFANSYGLDEPGHYSTAADLATLARYAMTYRAIREIVRKRTAVIGQGADRHTLETTNKLLGTYRGANGIKTGWTSDAGYNVIASARRGREELIAVVLGAHSERERFDTAAALLDWGFARYRSRSLIATGTVVGRARVTDFDDRSVPVVASQAATAPVFTVDGPVEATARYNSRIEAPVSRDETLGVLVFTQGGRMVATVPLVAGASVEAPGFFERIRIDVGRWWRSIFG